jgi:hypothetical protein
LKRRVLPLRAPVPYFGGFWSIAVERFDGFKLARFRAARHRFAAGCIGLTALGSYPHNSLGLRPRLLCIGPSALGAESRFDAVFADAVEIQGFFVSLRMTKIFASIPNRQMLQVGLK